jgi:hypothetical protein
MLILTRLFVVDSKKSGSKICYCACFILLHSRVENKRVGVRFHIPSGTSIPYLCHRSPGVKVVRILIMWRCLQGDTTRIAAKHKDVVWMIREPRGFLVTFGRAKFWILKYSCNFWRVRECFMWCVFNVSAKGLKVSFISRLRKKGNLIGPQYC